MKVFVKALATGKAFEIDAEPGESVQDFKWRIQRVEGSNPEQQRLILRGKNLKDGDTLASAGITKDGATLHLVLRLATSIVITVRTMAGKSVDVPVKPSDAAGSVMALLEDLLQIPAGEAALNFGGRRLDSELILSNVPVPDKATCHLIFRPCPQYRLAPGSSSPVEAEQSRLRVYGDLGSLYARCGGIFGIAGFVDRCMDKWMADQTLNANAAIATWHEKAQRCGFKFLVTELMGYLSGGPQRYTGRSMADSHKHLGISSMEWGVFMQIFKEVCAEFELPGSDAGDLVAILQSMEEDCVVQAGESGPPPKRERAQHDDKSLYALLGGVYPLALFSDRLIDALLADKRVKIPIDGQKRNEASLKYLFTEIVCSIAGGPEVITSTEIPETRLLIAGRKFFYLLDAAKDASDHLASGAHRAELIKCLYKAQHLIVDPERKVQISKAMRERQSKIERLGREAGMDLLYVPGGGLAKLDFDATVAQRQALNKGLATLGFKTVEKTRVKSALEAAAGNMLSSATIAARYAAPGAYVAARKRVHGDPQTLYGRGGGVFGLAKLADRLMDVWMSDPSLNANGMVAQWHTSQQKFGFKFLVTQIFGYLTGGPQRYTGQPMDVAHRHLGITSSQWDAFVRDLQSVCNEFKMDASTKRDLCSIVSSFRGQIVVQEGEAVPADPGLCRRPPSGSSLYAQAGGVYPLAHFADTLLERSLRDARLGIAWDRGDNPAGKRTMPGLKYLVTELVCSGAGGPEVVTSRGFDDAKLGVPLENWPALLEVAAEAASSVWGPSAEGVRESVIALLEEQKAELCPGLVPEDTSAPAAARRRLREAGYGHVETTAALSRCHGNAEEALALLVSGWTPQRLLPSAASPTAQGMSKCPFSGAAQAQAQGMKCPFSGQSASSGASCPFSRASAATASPSAATGAASSSERMAGRILGSALQEELDSLLYEDPDLSCPITLVLFCDPVVASDGCVYEKSAIEELIRMQGLSPMTHKPLAQELFPAEEEKARAKVFMEDRSRALLRFAAEAQKQGQVSMALSASDRLKDYVASLTPKAAPDLARALQDLCSQLGSPLPNFAAPDARIRLLLGQQVRQASEDAAPRHTLESPSTEKSVAFTVDVSGSMSGPRINKARENLLKIFDEYMEDEDRLTMITFDHQTHVQFELQEVGASRAALRLKAERACQVKGGTAFYDALIETTRLLESQRHSDSPQWIVSLTDGHDQHSKSSLDTALARIQESRGKPNLIIVGIQLIDPIKPLMRKLCTATESSIFIDASGSLEALDDAFMQVAELICE